MAWHACRQGTKVHGGGGELVTCPLPPTGTIPGQDPDPQPTPDFTGLGHLGWGGGGGGTLLKPRSTFMHMGAGQGGQCTEYRRWCVQGRQGLLSPTVCCTHLPLHGRHGRHGMAGVQARHQGARGGGDLVTCPPPPHRDYPRPRPRPPTYTRSHRPLRGRHH